MRAVSDFTRLSPALAHGTIVSAPTSNPPLRSLTSLQVVGVFALLSALAFALVASRCIHYLFLRREEGAHTAPENLLFRTHIGYYIGNLFLANVFLTVAGLMHFHWGTQSGISRGRSSSVGTATVCSKLVKVRYALHKVRRHRPPSRLFPLHVRTAIILQIGLWGSGYFTVATGVHTCTSLVFRARQVPWINLVCIAVGWIVALVVGEHHGMSDVIEGAH